MQIPLILPMLDREVQNHMYKAGSFYWAAIIASCMSFLFYPIISSPVSFWLFGLDDSGFIAFLFWTAVITSTATCGFTLGFLIGSIFRDQNTAISVNILFFLMQTFGGGMYANIG